ncbi:hypothetical protein KV557_26800 [Kitasatospora aureofaciens]|nr:hypothetical protein [Kitasatospora aureofaciens]
MVVAGTPRWAVRAAHVVPLVTLPSGLWRVALVAGLAGWGEVEAMGVAEKLYILGISAVAEGLAFLTLGLVRPWGEVLPRWVPVLGGRRVPARFAVVTAGVGAALVMAFCVYYPLNALVLHTHFGPTVGGQDTVALPHGLPLLALIVCYAPLVAWGPLLAAVTVAYHRRRRLP